MELVIGGVAASVAGFFSNPLEIVKIRMQLQGELQARGKYTVHYRNVFHAFYTIGKLEGITALQKGLVPALIYQFIMNGVRLGSYQIVADQGFTRKGKSGEISAIGALISGGFSGALGAIAGSPFYMVKTQLQSKSNSPLIAVGHQHEIRNMSGQLWSIFREQGIKGLWRGTTSQIPRVATGSSIQFLTFETSLEFVTKQKIFKEGGWTNTFLASLFSGIFVAFGMAPFDLVATRIYNQSTNSLGIGVTYGSWFDCIKKIHAEERVYGFFKGWTANYFRIGPHTMLLLIFWDRLKRYHKDLLENSSSSN